MKKCCKTCRYWNVHSWRETRGDCMSAAGHGYSRVPMGDGSFALLDTFGKPETTPTHVCEAWDSGKSQQEMAAVAVGYAVVLLFAKAQSTEGI